MSDDETVAAAVRSVSPLVTWADGSGVLLLDPVSKLAGSLLHPVHVSSVAEAWPRRIVHGRWWPRNESLRAQRSARKTTMDDVSVKTRNTACKSTVSIARRDTECIAIRDS